MKDIHRTTSVQKRHLKFEDKTQARGRYLLFKKKTEP